MVSHCLLLILLTFHVGNSSNFPVKIDNDCFVNFVFENEEYTEYPQELQISELHIVLQSKESRTLSYGVHEVANLSFSFDIEEIVFFDQLSISDGYFRFHSKYRQVCNLFLILATTFNTTITAITNSGFGTSEDALFIVIPPDGNENTNAQGFSTELKSLEWETKNAFYANLAFVSFESSKFLSKVAISVYCYRCPDSLGNLHDLEIDTTITLSTIVSQCKQWNRNGYQHTVYVHTTFNVSEEKSAPLHQPILNGRDNFYKSISYHYMADHLNFVILSKEMNMTIDPIIRQFNVEQESEVYWHLSVKEIMGSNLILRNVLPVTRGTFTLVNQINIRAMYCMRSSELVKITWDIYLRVLDFPTWVCIGMILLGYALIYKNVLKALDLIWIMFDMEFWYRHPRKILGFYLIGAVFLPWAYDGGMSTDFVNLESPKGFNKLYQSGYRLWVTQVKDFRKSTNLMPEYTKKAFLNGKNVKYVSDLFYNLDDIQFPTVPNKKVMVMAEKKLLLPIGLEAMFIFPSLVHALSVKELAVVETDFVCGTIEMSSRYEFLLASVYQLQGHMSNHLLLLMSISQEAGLGIYYHNLIIFRKSIVSKLKIEDVSSALSSSTLAVRTPLGAVCLAYVLLNLTLLISNLVWRCFVNWARLMHRLRNILANIISLYHRLCHRTTSVQRLEEITE
ncbi:unnamed protein product [Orchesella dallaii]|uniref:Uncharacterized protein n=1 Tax=Orchesella dallaii TaxID=48710 RepID=A0ABP1PKM6_9HEXA